MSYGIYLKNIKRGQIKLFPKQHLSSLEIELIPKGNPEEHHLFGYQSIIDYHSGFAYYNTLSLDSLDNNHLLYHKEIGKLRFKHHKDKDYKQIEEIHEFFVNSVTPIEKFKKRGFSRDFSFKRKSHYNSPFWKDFSNHPLYKPLPYGVKEALSNKLTEMKAKNK